MLLLTGYSVALSPAAHKGNTWRRACACGQVPTPNCITFVSRVWSFWRAGLAGRAQTQRSYCVGFTDLLTPWQGSNTHTHTHIHTHARTHTNIHAGRLTVTDNQTHTHTYMHACRHGWLSITHTITCALMHAETYSHTEANSRPSASAWLPNSHCAADVACLSTLQHAWALLLPTPYST